MMGSRCATTLMKDYFIYIIINQRNTVLYVGMTNDIARRMYEHKNKITKGFASKYNIDKLVYIEQCYDPQSAIEREKEIKRLHRKNKIKLIELENPNWEDLSGDLI